MNTNSIRPASVSRWMLALILVCVQLVWAAPGGIGGTGTQSEGVGGIGGTGIIGIGFVQRFGSIFVNGTEFELDAQTRYWVDGKPEQSVTLRTGDAVLVLGAMQDGKPFARQVRIEHAIEGAVESINAPSRSLTVLGQTVVIADGAHIQSHHGRILQLASLRRGDFIRVSAIATSAGHWLAYGIDLRPTSSNTQQSMPILLRGRVHGIDSLTQVAEVDGLSVHLPADALSKLQIGETVRLTGQLQGEAVRWLRASHVTALGYLHTGVHVSAVGQVSGDGHVLSSPVGHIALTGMAPNAGSNLAFVEGSLNHDATLDVVHMRAGVDPMTTGLPAALHPSSVTQMRLTGRVPAMSAKTDAAMQTNLPDPIPTLAIPNMVVPSIQAPSIATPSIATPSFQTPPMPTPSIQMPSMPHS